MIRKVAKEALVFGLFAMIQVVAVQLLALTFHSEPSMTVTLTFRDGSTSVFTGASYTIVGDVITVTGTNEAGVAGEFGYHWSDVKSVSRVP